MNATDGDEGRRQAALRGAIDDPGAPLAGLRLAGGAARAAPTLAAWRQQAAALADRALRPVFPTVRAQLGDADFARLAREFRAAEPPIRGDLGEWGAGLPAFVDAHAGLSAWPWLGDVARLDLARHRCERAFDACVDAASLARLQTESPARLRLTLVPGCAVVASRWPLAAIDAAHRAPAHRADAAFAAVRAALARRQGESVMIVRAGFRATVQPLDPAGVAWTQSLLDGRTLADALDRAGPAFDFAGWLATAVRRTWLSGVVRVAGDDDDVAKGPPAP